MSNVRTIYLDWNGGVIRSEGGPQLARQYDHLSNLVVFRNAPPLENYYLIVKMMAAEDDVAPHEMEPIRLAGPYWLIPNVYTQLVQPVIFQVCCKTETGDFEHHSAKYTLNVIESLGHDGSELEVDPSIMFDPYSEYVDEKVQELIDEAGGISIDTRAYVDQKITEMVAAAGEVIIDSTLSISGAAADAKATGDAISETNERLGDLSSVTGTVPIPMEPGYIVNKNATVDRTAVVASTTWKHAVISVSEGDEFIINGYGAQDQRTYSVIDENGNNLLYSPGIRTLTNVHLKIPENGAYLILNDNQGYTSYYGNHYVKNDIDVLTAITGNKEITTYLGRILLSTGATLNPAINYTIQTARHALIPCSEGDEFTITSNSESLVRSYAFTSSDYTVLERAGTSDVFDGAVITAPANSAYLMINCQEGQKQYYGKLIKQKVEEAMVQADLHEESNMLQYAVKHGMIPITKGWEVGIWSSFTAYNPLRYAYSYTGMTVPFDVPVYVYCPDLNYGMRAFRYTVDEGGNKTKTYEKSPCRCFYVPAGECFTFSVMHIVDGSTDTSIVADLETFSSKVFICAANSEFIRRESEYASASMFKRIGIIGDSFAFGANSSKTGEYTWPAIMSRLLGNTVEMFARGGLSTSTWITNTDAGLPVLTATGKCHLYWYGLGINDASNATDVATAGTIADLTTYEDVDYTTADGDEKTACLSTLYGRIGYIIRSVQKYSPYSKIIIASTIGTFYLNEVGYSNYRKMNNILMAVADFYGLPFVDFRTEPFYMTDVYGYQYSGQPRASHPLVPAYSGMAQANIRLIQKAVYDNIEYFRDYTGDLDGESPR